MNWIKLHTGIHRNPKVRTAEAECHGAREVFILVLCMNGEHEFDGVIPAAYASPAYMGLELGMQRDATERCIATLCNTGLLHVDSDGNCSILGYSDEWRPRASTSTQRSRKSRDKAKRERVVTGSRNDKQRSATKMQRSVACNEEESRGEESRSLSPAKPEGPTLLTNPKPKEPPLPFTVAALLAALEEGSGGLTTSKPFDDRMAPSITLVIRQCAKESVTLADVRLAGEYIASRWGEGREVGPKWVASAGNLLDVVGKARRWSEAGRPAREGASKSSDAEDRYARSLLRSGV